MLATGVMGYSIETRATMEYWFNVGGDVFPAEWKHKVTGMVWGGGKAFGTYFTGDPAWIYGINWLPASPSARPTRGGSRRCTTNSSRGRNSSG